MTVDLNILQVIIAVMLFFVLLFGIGFILNMLLKTTWFPIYLYILVMLPLVIYWQWDDSSSLWGNLADYGWIDYITALGGLAGALASGSTIKTLREKGYRMF